LILSARLIPRPSNSEALGRPEEQHGIDFRYVYTLVQDVHHTKVVDVAPAKHFQLSSAVALVVLPSKIESVGAEAADW